MAIGAGQGLASYGGKRQAWQWQRRWYQETVARSEESAELQLDAVRERQHEEQRSTAQEVEAVLVEAMRRKGTLSVSAAEAGVAGGLVEDLDRDFTGAALNNTFGLEINLAAINRQMNQLAKGIRVRQAQDLARASADLEPKPSIYGEFWTGVLGSGAGSSAGSSGR